MEEAIKSKDIGKVVRSFLFVSVWLFVIFSKNLFLDEPHGNVGFAVHNVATILLTIFTTGIFVALFQKKALLLIACFVFIAAITVAII